MTSRSNALLSSNAVDERFGSDLGNLSPEGGNENKELLDALAAARYNGVKIGPCRILFSSSTYCEFIDNPRYSRVPNAPSRMRGLINLRGNLIPLYQVHEYLERFSNEDRNVETRQNELNAIFEKANALVVGQVSNAAALLIEGKPTMFTRADAKPVKNIPSIPDFVAPSVINILDISNEVWFEVDSDDFFRRLSTSGFPDITN